MIDTKLTYKGIPVWLDTDDESYAESLRRDARYDSPLLKELKKDRYHGRKDHQTERTR
jgi:hypothetical protein